MKIAVVGCGAVGSYYGARLCRDEPDVHFLLRSDFDTVRRRGVQIRSPEGDFHVHPRCARVPEQVGVCDLVLIALKTTANAEFPRLLPPLVGPGTAVLTLQNGLGNEESLAALFGPERVMGGLCFVCLNRVEPGVIRHLAHGLIVLGEYRRRPGPRTLDIAARIRHAGVLCQVTDNLERAHWEKLVWNIPFNGLGVAAVAGYEGVMAGRVPPGAAGGCLTTDLLLGDSRWLPLVRELMLEVIRAGQALGHPIPESLADEQIERTRVMGAYRASTLLDYERGLPLEVESLFVEPWRRARAAGVSTPRLAALCEVLNQLEERRGRPRIALEASLDKHETPGPRRQDSAMAGPERS
jgi:2-dehydropantoate 2-reductase